MLEYEEFEKYMLRIKDEIEKEDAIDKALRNMSPDFGGFCTECADIMVDLLQKLMHDEYKNLEYYVWETEWGTQFDKIWDADGNEIPFKTIKDVYNVILDDNKRGGETNDM